MKKKILEALKNRYKNMGFGDKALDGVASYLEPSVKEDADIETAIAGVESLLKVFQGDADKLRTDKSAAEKRLADLEAKVKELGGEPAKNEPETKNGNEDNDTPAWAKKIMERLDAIEGDKVTANRKQKFDAIIGKLPESLRKPYARTDIKSISDDEFDTLLSEVGTEVEELAKNTTAKGAVFGRPANSNTIKTTTDGVKEATDEEAQSVVDRMNL